jgi:hypothetical protein
MGIVVLEGISGKRVPSSIRLLSECRCGGWYLALRKEPVSIRALFTEVLSECFMPAVKNLSHESAGDPTTEWNVSCIPEKR